MGRPRRTLRQHIERKLGKRVMEAAGATRVLTSDGTHHILGTAHTGTDPATSVVGPDCRTHDVPNRWVCDGSVWPTAGAVNSSLCDGLDEAAVASAPGDEAKVEPASRLEHRPTGQQGSGRRFGCEGGMTRLEQAGSGPRVFGKFGGFGFRTTEHACRPALDDLNFSIFADWPGAIHEGGGQAVAYTDERADEAQQHAIAALVRGEAGGPWAIFITTYDLDGPHCAPYEVEAAGERSYYRIGALAELQVEPIRNAVTGNEVHPRLLLPEGLLARDLGLFRSQKFRVEDAISYDHSGRYAAVGAFANSGP